MDFVRPKLNSTCNFLFICKNGSQLANFGDALGRMTYQAICKYVNRTRYRQIIETESSDLLSVAEQEVISLDQKHTSNVAKVHCQKKRSRSVAQKAMNCMEKLINNSETTIEEQSSGHSLGSGPDKEMESSSVEYSIIEPPMTRQRAKITKTVGIQKIKAEGTSTSKRQKKTQFTKEEDSFLLKG